MSGDGVWLAMMTIALLGGIVSGIPVILAIAGIPLLTALAASLFGAFDPRILQAFPQRIYGVMNNGILVAVPLFIFMGMLLEKSRAAERMLVSLSGLLGGSGQMMVLSVLLVSALIAASTGIIGATIVMLGMMALPAMLSSGVSSHLSSGLICAAGTLGQIIPPSIVLILLGDQISNAHVEAQRELGNFAPDPVTVGDLFAGAIVPGFLLVFAYGIYSVFAIGFRDDRNPSPERSDGPPIADVARRSWDVLLEIVPPVLLIVAVLGSILFGIATATEAAAVGAAGTLLLSAANGGFGQPMRILCVVSVICAFALVVVESAGISQSGLGMVISMGIAIILGAGLVIAFLALWRNKVMQAVIDETIQISAMIFGIIIAASLLSLVFRGFNGDEIVRDLLTGLPGDKWGMLLVTMAVIFFLGFVLEFVEIVFIVIPIVGPILLAADFDPVWLAILFALNLQTSFLTPPFGFALFYFRSVAPPEISTWTIYRSIQPFVIIQLLVIALVAALPQLATWLPDRLYAGY